MMDLKQGAGFTRASYVKLFPIKVLFVYNSLLFHNSKELFRNNPYDKEK